MKTIYRLLFVLLSSNFLSAQDQKYMDSLMVASKSTIDSVRFKAYSFLSWNLKEKDKAGALKYATLLLNEATAKDNKKWIARSLSDLSVIYEYSGDIKTAMEYAEKTVPVAKLAGNKKDLAGALFNLSVIKSKNNQLGEAMELQLQALKIYEELKKNYYIAVTCNALGMSYNNIGNYKLSNVYLRRAFEISKTRSDIYLQSITLGAMGDNYKSLNQVDSSMTCYKLAKSMFKEMEDYSNYATACNNLGELYFQSGRIKNSESEYKEALEVSRTMQDTGGIAIYQANLAKVLITEGDYSKAEELLLNSLVLAKKLGNGEAELIVCENLVNLYIHKKNPAMADVYFRKYASIKDTMFSRETAVRFSEAQTKFDVEKKDLEILKNRAELERNKQERAKKNLFILLILTVLIASGISGVLFYRKKQAQVQLKHEAEIAAQRDIRARAIIEAEEKERRRIAQDLHDGVGQILSAAKLNLSSLGSTIRTGSQAEKDALENTLALIDDSVKEVRAVSHNMMPNTLIKLGLASAIREFITRLGSFPNLKIDLEIVGLDKRLEESKEMALYRAIQEIVNNIIKHAKANKIGIQLIRHEKELSVVIEDNGVGFDSDKINEFEGIGLKNILSRIEFINGEVHFDSVPGRGTTVLIDLPV